MPSLHVYETIPYSVRLSITQSSLEVLGKQIHFFMCCDVLFAQHYMAFANTPKRRKLAVK